MALITEDHLEKQCLEWFKELEYAYAFAPDLAPDSLRSVKNQFTVEQLITLVEKYLFAPVAALGHVVGKSGDNQTGKTIHENRLFGDAGRISLEQGN